ncbi:PREDICTED: regucalcin-like [Nicrophorus vespilloides]|uniref:Regucalcin n=1 Tax=Nicrophorus vespilloides TaxID=110193 RepID=A0ABM1NF10_NICVS|nr:PREDICTED: regucalcin-like [Nicrophorus vespilloides]XP_017785410.1 PREDICTED: regucalcin-like [Nicrophorus vespilloides]
MAPAIEVVSEEVILGEGPHWDEQLQCLYYVDIFGQAIHKFVPSTNSHTKVVIEGGPVTLLVPVEGTTDQFLISVGRKLEVVTWDGISKKVSRQEHLLEVETEADVRGNRWNDGKADPVGRLWAGTMGPEPEIGKLEKEKGSLYTLIAKHRVRKHLEKVSIANGLAWNIKLKRMYYIDSPKRTVDQYDYDITKGEIKNCKPIFDLDKHDIPGVPDGMTIDTDGNLWVAVFDGGRLLHINPNTGKLIQTIYFPAKQITACAFGGPNMDVLYVTSAKLVVKGEEQPKPAGALFRVTRTGCRGIPGYKVDLEKLH